MGIVSTGFSGYPCVWLRVGVAWRRWDSQRARETDHQARSEVNENMPVYARNASSEAITEKCQVAAGADDNKWA